MCVTVSQRSGRHVIWTTGIQSGRVLHSGPRAGEPMRTVLRRDLAYTRFRLNLSRSRVEMHSSSTSKPLRKNIAKILPI